MKIVIAAAGRGTRMRNLSQNQPKHLIEVAGKPFLYYLLENIKRAGYSEIIVVGGYCIEQMREFLSGYDENIELIDQNKYILDDSYGTICPLKSARYFVMDESFVFVSGDNLYSPEDLRRFQNLDKDYSYVGGINHPKPQLYGCLKIENDLVKEIIEKPKKQISNYINTGIYKFNSDIFSCVNKVKKSTRGEFELTDAINILAKQDKVKFIELADYWYDFGKPEDVNKIQSFLSK
ncbi:MAG: sugar phosphate nucleotidyltransferase [Patescibacteria group bacterium]